MRHGLVLSKKTRATYQQPPRPAERERVSSVGDERVGVLRTDRSSFSPSECGWVGRREEGSEMGDASWVEVEASMSGDGWSNSGDDAWLPLSGEEGGICVIKAMAEMCV